MSNIFKKYSNDFLKFVKSEGNITLVYLFGSYADNTYNENSDIDIAVMYDDDIDEYEHAGKSIDVSKIFDNIDVDYIDLNKVNVFLQFEILKKGKLIYCTDEKRLQKFMDKVQRQYIEMNYEKQKYIKYVLNEEGEKYGAK